MSIDQKRVNSFSAMSVLHRNQSLICSTNQWTGFYMIRPSVTKELNQLKWTRDKETCAEGMILQSYFVSEYTFLISENNNHTNKQ